MSRRSVLRLIQVARPAPNDDCIGIALFGAMGSNQTFVAECNDDLNIARFTEFVDFESFGLDIDIPANLRAQRFSIGDPIPIPYWVNGRLGFAMGDTQTLGPMPKGAGDGVMASVVGLIKDARSGALRQRSLQWESDYLRGANSDIFQQKPRDTRHWVARFAVVARELDWRTKEQTKLKDELYQLGHKWLQLFLASTTFTRLSIFLGIGGKPHMFGRRRRHDIMLAYLLHIIAEGRFKNIEAYVDNYELIKLFPKGIAAEKQVVWTDLKYPLNMPRDLTESFLEYVRAASEVDEWKTVERLAYLMYRKRDIPRELQLPILDYMSRVTNDFLHSKNDYSIPHRKEVNYKDDLVMTLIGDIYPNVDAMKSIFGVLDGKQRLVSLNHDSPQDMISFEKNFMNKLNEIRSRLL